MPITGGKSKSRAKRKPLRDVSNGALKLSVTHSVMKKFNPQPQQQEPATTCGGGGGGGGSADPLDRLLLVHSDLSSLIHKIDELVVQALEKKVSNEKEIESFAHVLQEMQNSLKPWVSRFQNILPARVIGSNSQLETSLASMKITPSINEETSKNLVSPYVDKFDFLVSPSPLVSWRADCAADGGRNLFLLTPLPKRTPFSSRLKKSSKSVFEKLTSDVTVRPVRPVADNFNIAIDEKTTVDMTSDATVRPAGPVADNISIAINEKTTVENVFSSPEKVVRRNDSIIVSTPYMKMSPPKSCMLLEPSSEWCNKINGTKKRPLDPVGGGSGDSDPSSCQLPSGHLALKYPELFGIRPACKMGNARKVVEASPNWCMLMSPPKTCVLLEPSDDDQIKDVETKLKKDVGIASVVSCKEAVIDSTPMCKDLDTTILKGKRAGENTLKKELWTRFEAATAHGFHFKSSFDQENGNDSGTNKGFMDLLEEASCD
ncbi:hypothetical protein L1987_45262 [Smallanthus sonchifolius]|uniref:Uncharacterized protein n=1 Tax=Smallanthus sonchifolius TaxID=185202 RepID=A0ACB9GSX8_9ASTR|nr:hypothetical protein L1987_45262 [Smallanthus sonchifolius]